MALNPSDPNVMVATFGKQVSDFLDTDLGIYLSQCAERDRQNALDQLRTIDPFEEGALNKIAAAQHKLRIADCFMSWLAEAVAKGMQALQQLQEDTHG